MTTRLVFSCAALVLLATKVSAQNETIPALTTQPGVPVMSITPVTSIAAGATALPRTSAQPGQPETTTKPGILTEILCKFLTGLLSGVCNESKIPPVGGVNNNAGPNIKGIMIITYFFSQICLVRRIWYHGSDFFCRTG